MRRQIISGLFANWRAEVAGAGSVELDMQIVGTFKPDEADLNNHFRSAVAAAVFVPKIEYEIHRLDLFREAVHVVEVTP